jgi:hypothetical protein
VGVKWEHGKALATACTLRFNQVDLEVKGTSPGGKGFSTMAGSMVFFVRLVVPYSQSLLFQIRIPQIHIPDTFSYSFCFLGISKRTFHSIHVSLFNDLL